MKRWIGSLVIGIALMGSPEYLCPLHPQNPCTMTGQHAYQNGKHLVEYACTCGDVYWIVN